MAAQVTGLELVTADGTIATCSAGAPAASPPASGAAGSSGTSPPVGLLDAARVGLGALGVLTAVTFRVVPAFLLEAREEPMRWSEVISRLDELTSANEHFEFYWFPHTEGCLTKRNNRSAGPERPLGRLQYLLEDELLSNTVFGAICRLGHAVPAVIKTVNGVAGKALGSRSYVDAPYKVFTSPRRVRFKEQEYAIPRESLADVLAEVRALFSRRGGRDRLSISGGRDPPGAPWASPPHRPDNACPPP